MRSLFAGLLGLESEPAAWPRPPGALEEGLFKVACTGCGDCVSACPHRAIGKLADGTVALDPNAVPCHLCSDMPCITACTDGALRPVPLEGVFFGLARVLPDRCMVFQGPECGACKPACPIGALRLVLGRPEVNADSCNGCGLCRDACPVWNKAITIDW